MIINLESDTLISPFIHSLQSYPDRPALWLDGVYYSYQELYALSSRLAQLIKIINSAQCIILSKRNLTAYTAIIAALLADKTYVPINSHLPLACNINIFLQLDARIMIVDSYGCNQAQAFLEQTQNKFHIIFPEHEVLPEWCADLNQHCYFSKQDIATENSFCLHPQRIKNPYAYLLFTSGTTGIPKGVLVSHCNILHFINNIIKSHKFSIADRFSQIFELTFDPSIFDMFICWSVGACLFSINEKHLFKLPQFIRDHALTVLAIVPSLLTFILSLQRPSPDILAMLRLTIFGGEVLSEQLANNWQKIAPNSIIENHYGPTEATIAICSYRWQSKEASKNGIVPIGRPFLNQAIAIINEEMSPVLTGEVGELCLAGSQVVNKYWQSTHLSTERFIQLPSVDNGKKIWYRTGDLVAWDDSVGLHYKGRIDDQLQIRGCRVEKLEIESALKSLAKTEEVALIAWPVTQEGHILGLVAFVSNSPFEASSIKKLCKAKLADYMIPSKIVSLKSLPLTINKKVDYSALFALMEGNHAIAD